MRIEGPSPQRLEPPAPPAPRAEVAIAAAPAPRRDREPRRRGEPHRRTATVGAAHADEQAFFSQQQALGTLTYGPSRAAAPGAAAPTGGRLDVRG